MEENDGNTDFIMVMILNNQLVNQFKAYLISKNKKHHQQAAREILFHVVGGGEGDILRCLLDEGGRGRRWKTQDRQQAGSLV